MAAAKHITQDFLDGSQYLTDSILLYERVYGTDFVSPGGLPMATEMIECLQLEPGARVLDVGCGLGGSAFLMARDYGLQVDGIDLSKNMLAIANRKLRQYDLEGRVNLQWGDCLQLDCEDRYDAIYSRDVFLHIHDKNGLFAVLHRALKSGGQLLFTDYCCGPRPWSDDFSDYIGQRGYCLHEIDEYAALISAAGFKRSQARDLSSRFVDILENDLSTIGALDLEPAQVDDLQQSWTRKLARSRSGDHRWGLFTANKGD